MIYACYYTFQLLGSFKPTLDAQDLNIQLTTAKGCPEIDPDSPRTLTLGLLKHELPPFWGLKLAQRTKEMQYAETTLTTGKPIS